MTSAALRLKELRLTARPPLSMRAAAEKLGMGHSTYGFYENPNYFKKSHLPVELARRIAALFAQHGIDPADVMKLAGLTEDEAEPEVREIEAAKPKVRYFTAQVPLPSEAALAAMFEPLLAMIPEEATLREAAHILARRLPDGFAAIGPAVLEVDLDASSVDDEHPPIREQSHPERSWRLRK